MFKETDIFGPYSDGRGNSVMADPLKVYRTLIREVGGDLKQTLADSNSSDLDVHIPAEETLVRAAVTAFNLAPFDPVTGTGSTETQILSVLDTFLNWIKSFQQPDTTLPTSVRPTGIPVVGIP